ncbi:hypothetical protein MASR2M17_22380 [Aminivibrio sp.]
MAKELKPTVWFEESFEKLDIRVGRVTEVQIQPGTRKPTYRMVIDMAFVSISFIMERLSAIISANFFDNLLKLFWI